MSRLIIALLVSFSTLFSIDAFSVSQSTRQRVSAVSMSSNDDGQTSSSINSRFVERGVSVDQDGKSNVWAIEPKMEVDTKSAEEKTLGTAVALGGFAAFAVVAAGILTNLPDPNQF